jgi:hypothetical protein
MRRFYLHRRPRELRIQGTYRAIYRASMKGKGTTLRRLAAQQHVTTQTMRKYVKTIQRRLRWKDTRILQLDGKLFYLDLAAREAEIRKQVVPTRNHVELHAYINYSGQNGRNRIDLDIVVIVPKHQQAILAAVEEIRGLVEHRFSSKRLGSMLKFGTSSVTLESRSHFLYRHGQGEWHAF